MMIVDRSQRKEIYLDPALDREKIDIREDENVDIYIEANKKLYLEVGLMETGASVRIIGRFLGHDGDTQEITLRVTAFAPHTDCDIRFRAALNGSSSSFFDGMIRVEEGAKESRGYLSYHALLLSPDAQAKPIPRLEVLTKEVASLSHAASVGSIDANQLFYLQSRGLSRIQAERIIVEGFLRTIDK